METTTSSTPWPSPSAASQRANFAKEDEAGDAAAHRRFITAFENLLDAEKRYELLQLAVLKGFSVQRSSSLFNNFGAHPTGLKHRVWTKCCDGRKAAMAAFRGLRGTVRAASAQANDATEEEVSAAAALEMKARAWDTNKITAGIKPTNKQVAAVLRCKFKLQKEVKRTANKPVLLAKLALCTAKWRQKHQLPPPSKMLGTMRTTAVQTSVRAAMLMQTAAAATTTTMTTTSEGMPEASDGAGSFMCKLTIKKPRKKRRTVRTDCRKQGGGTNFARVHSDAYTCTSSLSLSCSASST